MTHPKHSPLPWTLGGNGLIYDADDEFVVDTYDKYVPEGIENGKLIILAANNYHQHRLKEAEADSS